MEVGDFLTMGNRGLESTSGGHPVHSPAPSRTSPTRPPRPSQGFACHSTAGQSSCHGARQGPGALPQGHQRRASNDCAEAFPAPLSTPRRGADPPAPPRPAGGSRPAPARGSQEKKQQAGDVRTSRRFCKAGGPGSLQLRERGRSPGLAGTSALHLGGSPWQRGHPSPLLRASGP